MDDNKLISCEYIKILVFAYRNTLMYYQIMRLYVLFLYGGFLWI